MVNISRNSPSFKFELWIDFDFEHRTFSYIQYLTSVSPHDPISYCATYRLLPSNGMNKNLLMLHAYYAYSVWVPGTLKLAHTS
jgi:hypothetical protein